MANVLGLVDRLIEQTELGNIEWSRGSAPGYFVFQASSGLVVLRSVDNDGLFPIRFEVWADSETRESSFQVNQTTVDMDEEAFDDRVRRLWYSVNQSSGTVAKLIEELDRLPPF